jgi:hypothetical protein
MAAAGVPESRFRVWIRRRNEASGAFAIRFEVPDGKGILRVARPGVLVDPPARPSGFEERLTAAQVRASRFLHVWDGGRHRQGHLLARLEESALDRLPLDRWVELRPGMEGSTALLVLPAEAGAGADLGVVDDEPTWPRRQLDGLQRELALLGDAGPVDMDEWATEVRPATGGTGRRRVENVEIPRTTTPRPIPPAAPAPPRSLSSLLAEVGPPEEDSTVLIRPGVDRTPLGRGQAPLPGTPPVSPLASPRPRTALPFLDEVPLDPSEDYTTIEAFDAGEALEALEAFDGGGESDEEGGLEAEEDDTDPPSNILEALEAGPDEDEEPDRPATSLGAPDASRRLTEPVTVLPATLGRYAVEEDILEANEADEDGYGADDAAVHAGPAARGPALRQPRRGDAADTLHERNTTLVRHLRRRITADASRIAVLERRVAELEAELRRR